MLKSAADWLPRLSIQTQKRASSRSPIGGLGYWLDDYQWGKNPNPKGSIGGISIAVQTGLRLGSRR